METCRVPVIPKFQDHIKWGDPVLFSLNPVVVLEDFRKSVGKDAATMSVKLPPEMTEGAKPPSPRMLTPPRSTPSPSLVVPPTSGKKRRKDWDPTADYEIEKIVGYHRDEGDRMWYLVKWKGWSSKHNTFEPIENLTGCNYFLMKYFETKRPPKGLLRKKEAEIEEAVRAGTLYAKLKVSGYRPENLEEFSSAHLDIGRMFTDLDAFENHVRQEYKFIVRCLVSMYSHQDPGLFLRAQKYRLCLKLIKRRRKQLKNLAAAQEKINSLESVAVTVENAVDLDHFPEMEYVVEMRLGAGVVVPQDPPLGCDCSDGCSARSHCCGKMGDSWFAYNARGRLRCLERVPIYECNRRCRCPETCPNRVVQHGRRFRLCIFKTGSCGWGVKALERIPRGAFVCEYLGELIPDAVAVDRDAHPNGSYLFDLDFATDLDSELFCIDATRWGNVARFINHSCDPNLVVYPVWIDCLEPSLHRLAFFAKRNIRKGEEIHFDYENVQERVPDAVEPEEKDSHRVKKIARVRCQCNAPRCRKWIFGNS